MWHTSHGDRTLTGPEAALFRYGLRSLVDFLTSGPDHDWATGVAAFDDIRQPQKIALLWEVANALLQQKVPAPKLTAVNEAAVAAVYGHIQTLIDEEIDARPKEPDVRDLVLDCLRQEFEQEGLKLPLRRSTDQEEWSFLVDTCADRILWDRDFEAGEQFLDTPPEEASRLRELLRIDDDYYAAPPPDLKPRQLEDCLRKLKNLADGSA